MDSTAQPLQTVTQRHNSVSLLFFFFKTDIIVKSNAPAVAAAHISGSPGHFRRPVLEYPGTEEYFGLKGAQSAAY